MGLLSRMSRAATALTKYYIPYTWRNKPSIVSPVNEVNLNHIEDGINELDNRILILAQDKADAADVANVIIDFTMDDTTGVMTFTRFDGSTFTHDTAVEKIALNCYLEGDSFCAGAGRRDQTEGVPKQVYRHLHVFPPRIPSG